MPEPEEVKELYVEARVHNTAHAQVSTQDEHRARSFAVAAAILAVLSGASWTKLGGALVSDQTAQLVAALSAFAAAIVSGVVAAMHWTDAATAHTKAAARWGTVRGDIEFARLHGNGGWKPLADELTKLQEDVTKAREDEPNLTPEQLGHAMDWLRENRPAVFS